MGRSRMLNSNEGVWWQGQNVAIPGMRSGDPATEAQSLKMYFMRRAFSRAKERSSSQTSQNSSVGSGGRLRQSRSGSGGGAQGLKLSSSTESSLLDDFHQAVEENDCKKLEELIEDINDVDATTVSHEYPALHVAADKGYNEIAELLLEYGASPTSRSDCMESPLMLACSHRNKTIAQLLLNHGADINYEDPTGVTALIMAVRNGDIEIVRLLLDYGANLNKKTKYEYLPLGVRWSMDYPDVSKDFCAEMCEPFRENSVLMGACRERHLQVVLLLLSHGADIHMTNSAKNTALHIAAYSKSQMEYYSHTPHSRFPPTCPDIVAELLRRGAEVDILNIFEETPLDRTISQMKQMDCIQASHSEVETIKNHFINFSHLIKAGNPFPVKHLDSANLNRSLFKVLLQAFNQVQNSDTPDKACLKAYILAIKVAVYSGLRPDTETIMDLKSCLKGTRLKRDLMDFLNSMEAEGYTLKQLCRIKLRKLIKRPLMKNVMSNDLVLPSVLRQYITMDYFV